MSNLYFTCRRGAEGVGSVYLRAYQILDALKRKGIKAKFRNRNERISNKTIIYIKPGDINEVRNLMFSNKVIIDPLDDIIFINSLDKEMLSQMSVIFHCLEYKKMFEDRVKETFYIPHHWDYRLRDFKVNRNINECKVATIGCKKPYIPDVVKPELKIVKTSHVAQLIETWKHELNNYNCHYILDQDSTNIIRQRPSFTKGTIASISDSVIITNRNLNALYFLGEEYPFYIDDESDNGILETVKRVKNSYGNDDWNRALDIVRTIKDKTHIDILVDRYIEFIK
jgi:hypothetical protein